LGFSYSLVFLEVQGAIVLLPIVRSGNIQYYIFCRVDTGFVRLRNIQYYIFCRVNTAQQLDVFTKYYANSGCDWNRWFEYT